jgi:hypothetical protein
MINPKSEFQNPKQIQISNDPNMRLDAESLGLFRPFEFSPFEIARPVKYYRVKRM